MVEEVTITLGGEHETAVEIRVIRRTEATPRGPGLASRAVETTAEPRGEWAPVLELRKAVGQ